MFYRGKPQPIATLLTYRKILNISLTQIIFYLNEALFRL